MKVLLKKGVCFYLLFVLFSYILLIQKFLVIVFFSFFLVCIFRARVNFLSILFFSLLLSGYESPLEM